MIIRILVVLLISVAAHADVLVMLGENNIYEREAYATQYSSRAALAIRAGYQESAVTIFGEYNQYSTSDGISQVQISRTERTLLAWARYSFWPEEIFQIYVQAAPGVQFERINSSFMEYSEQNSSKPYFAFTGAVGMAAQWNRIRGEVELRALTSELAAPNPNLALGFYLGYLF